jgi:hypothetical protein
MPERYHIIIKRSERNDDVGKRLKEKLYSIYDAYVLEHDGIWMPDDREEDHLREMCGWITEELSWKYKEATK